MLTTSYPHLDLVFSTPPLTGSSCPDHKSKSEKKPKTATENHDMSMFVDPEEDLERLIRNEAKLRLCGFYYGNLKWCDASRLLRKSKVGTFLLRDSEHSQYLYALTVQTKKGATSCRIEYHNGKFRLDSSVAIASKMPLFDTVTDLVDHYVYMTKNLYKGCRPPIWLDMDEENSFDVPVEIYQPLYKEVRTLQHMCRVNLVGLQRQRFPHSDLNQTLSEQPGFRELPNMIKGFLMNYPYSQ